jgi:hypothetical protein
MAFFATPSLRQQRGGLGERVHAFLISLFFPLFIDFCSVFFPLI